MGMVTDEQADAIELLAEERQVSMSSIVREAIREYLAREKAEHLAAVAAG
jgi:predicted transcriptional regulator